MVRIYLAVMVGASVYLAGCATGPSYSDKMNTWIGGSITTFINHQGAPSQTFERPDGLKTYIWQTSNGSSGTYNPYSRTVDQSDWFCKTEVTVRGDRIVNWRGYGNSCQ